VVEHVVVVGASLGGLRTVQSLRSSGFTGKVTLVGEEHHLPYDRPPLSKELLAGRATVEEIVLRPADTYGAFDVDLRLGTRATGLDLDRREVELSGSASPGGGERLGFDGLVIATGASPRRLPGTPPMAGIHVLRTLDDCLSIAADLDRNPRVVVVGAGFIGSEVASTCRERGLEVTVVEALPVPLVRAVGPVMGDVLAGVHRDHGVQLRTGVGVGRFDGGDRVERVVLADGSAIAADVVVVGVGVSPEVGWLEGSGLTLADGVVCDATCSAAPGVVAAGDVARWPNPLLGDMRVEHWTNASDQGAAAARTLLTKAAGGEAAPFAPVPYVWSDQYGMKIQYVGASRPDDEVTVVNGSTEDRRFVALYRRHDRVMAALAIGRPRLLMQARALIARRASWDEAVVASRQWG
jgi:NADPH-dependent 2,4-dienoyl-CoA reductase/sulfur reductase-like enzyme